MDTVSDFKSIPLVVDLDGTLIASDLLWEGLLLLLCRRPHLLLLVPFWLARGGPAGLKRAIATHVELDPAALPYRPEVLARIDEARMAGRRVVLATGTPRRFAEAIAGHLGRFDAVFSTEQENLTARNKCRALEAAYGDGGFDYIGNSRHDLCLFDSARRAIVVAPDRAASRWQRANDGELLVSRRLDLRVFTRMLRVHQWLKNTLIVVPMMLSHQYGEPGNVLACLLAFVAFSTAASAVYILNDLVDMASDRKHPTKRNRPFAAGILPVPFGLASMAGLLLVSFATTAMLPLEFAGVLAAYLAATTVYSFYLKRTLLLDVLTLAGLYTARIIAGSAVTGVPVSFWLLAFSTFFFLSLALVKRYTEIRSLAVSAGGSIAGRSYRGEDEEIVAQAGMASAFSAAMVLALYVNSREVMLQYNHPWMVWPIVLIVLYLTMRIWMLARRGQMHDDPVVFLMQDWRSQLMIGLGAVLVTGSVLLP